MIEAGMKICVKGSEGVFTVVRQTVAKPNPLYCEYKVMNKRGEKFVVEVADIQPYIEQSFSIDWQDRYDIACPFCEHLMECEPSEFQKLGFLSMGSGCCPKCDEPFVVTFNPFANRMTTGTMF